MNYIIEILVFLFVFSLTDFVFYEKKRLHKYIYRFTFCVLLFLVAIKYYYGPDIALYVPLYDGMQDVFFVIKEKAYIDEYFEPGYIFFLSILKTFGISFWMTTVLITLIYFYAIYKVFQNLKSFHVFALFLLFLFDSNLIIYEYRQCLAVSFFLFSVFAYMDRKYFSFLVFAIISILFHKSAVFVFIGFFLATIIKYIQINNRIYVLLLISYVIMLLLPLKDIIQDIVSILPISNSALSSILHHVNLVSRFQSIAIIYLFLFFSMVLYSDSIKDKKWQMLVIFAFIFIVVFYQFYFMLNRLRSYFLPFIIFFAINNFSLSINKYKYIKQLFVVVIYLYSINFIRGYTIGQLELKSEVGKSTTIFDRLYLSKEEIINRNMNRASLYWDKEYLNP